MDTSELKLKLFRQIDSLEKSKLLRVYDMVPKLVQKDSAMDQWNDLSKAQQQGATGCN